MKRINLFALCFVTAISATLYSMERQEETPDLEREMQNLRLQEGQRPQTPRRPLQNIMNSRSNSRTTTPVAGLMPIEADVPNRPGTPLRGGAGTPTQVTEAMDLRMQALLERRNRGEIDDAQLGREVRALFNRGGGIPATRAQRENTPPQNPDQNRN
jgi:hypothetical protein